MIFDNAELLSYNHQSNFFGGDVIRYRTVKQSEIQGYVLDLKNISGVSGVISGIAALELSARDWDAYVVNGINFGSGRITNISFDDHNDVKYKKYNISLEIVDTGSLNNLPTGADYTNINYNNYKFIEALSETVSLDRNFEKDIYTHNIDISVNTSNITGSINLAKQIARNLFESNSFNSYIGNYYGISGKKSTYEESYDKIKGDCSFNQTTELFSNQASNYSIQKTYSYNRETDGIVTVSERGEIKATVESYIDVLTNAYKTESANSPANCLAVFNAYKENDVYSLNLIEVSKGTSLSRYEKMLSYEHTFTNNLAVNDGYFWEYTHDSSLSSDGIITTSEQGSIVGRGHRIDTKYNNALIGFDIVDNDINTRSQDAYNRYKTFIQVPFSSFFTVVKKDESYLKHVGSVNYSWEYSNDSSLVNNGNIIQSRITVSDQAQLPLTNNFNVFNYGEIEQATNSYVVSQKSVEIELRGKRNTPMSEYLTYAKGLISSDYKGDFLTDVSYSLSPFSNSFNLSASWGKIYE